jgi:hypothetical protein
MSTSFAVSGLRDAASVATPARTAEVAGPPPDRSFADVLAGRGGDAATPLLEGDAFADSLYGAFSAAGACSAPGASPASAPDGAGSSARPAVPVAALADNAAEDSSHAMGTMAKPERLRDEGDPRDPAMTYPAFPLAPSIEPQAASAASHAAFSPALTFEELLPQYVRRIAWSGDGKKGAVRLELGAGSLAGSTLLIEADDRDVRVHLSAPSDVDGAAWGERIRQRLVARGLNVEIEID